MDYDVIVVGSGIAGLTASAFLSQAGYSALLCEKESHCGGLVGSFERNGFVFDIGIRSIENSGTVFPMLRQLGLDIAFVKSQVSLGIEDKVIRLSSESDLAEYQRFLTDFYPESGEDIQDIITVIRQIMGYIEVLYGIDNPTFLDMKRDREYLLKVIVPWLLKYAFTIRKIEALNTPVVTYLKRYTQNPSLLDIIAQHFFRDTPAFFALSYFKLYLDYYYPLGGTGTLIDKLVAYIQDHQGVIHLDTEIVAINPEQRYVMDKQGQKHSYRALIWAADLKTLYHRIELDTIANPTIKRAVLDRRTDLQDKVGGDSIFTLYLALDLDKSYFEKIASAHFFYTPSRVGQSKAGPIPTDGTRQAIENWLIQYFALTTYEISCPVLRDETLAPSGKTGLIVSVLFDYQLTVHIQDNGWYEEFKDFCQKCMIRTLETSIFPGLKEAVIDQFSYTPLSIVRITGNSDGAITGWAFTNDSIPVEHKLPKILNSVRTPIPGIHQAGQWTFSPTGLPTAIITGKLAADQTMKALKKRVNDLGTV
jgi:phytoene dehydrogenase-like protein